MSDFAVSSWPVLPAAGRWVVARLDGATMPDADHLFYEFSEAFLFPGYFGENWNALWDCLRDLKWLPADGYLLIVENAQQMLSSSAEDRQTLLDILDRVVKRWAPVDFQVVLLGGDRS